MASYLSNLGGVFRSKGDNDGAIDAYVRALVHLKKAMPAVAEIENVVAAEESAAFALESDRFDKRALSYPIDRREITTEQDTECMLGHSGFLNTASSVLNNLGVLYKALGEPKSARRLYVLRVSQIQAHCLLPLRDCLITRPSLKGNVLLTSQVDCLPIQYTHTRRLKTDTFR